jgi:hypothetical protein
MNTNEAKPSWIKGWHAAGMWFVPAVGTELTRQDRLDGLKVRWGIGRMAYRVLPGLYALGSPNEGSPVLVTANYKLTFDSLRSHLTGLDAWILVLDTKGINVWCAAGKGTFGTAELIAKIGATKLASVVRHRTLVLPQLGAPGIAAHEVTVATGFKVVYGPVRAADIPRFLDNGMKADRQMRTVTFGLRERLAVVPVELVQSWKMALALLIFYALSWIAYGTGLSWMSLFRFLPYLGAIIVGCVAVPALLPWIPGRSFAFKGWLAGMVVTIIYDMVSTGPAIEKLVLLLVLPAVSAFMALNFTGASTYTSLSGVRKEMKYAIPLVIISAVFGILAQAFGIWRCL